MYHKRESGCFLFALVYYIVYMLGLVLMGILYQRGFRLYNIVYYVLFAGAVGIAWFRERSFQSLGLAGPKWKANLLISLLIVAGTFLASVFLWGTSLPQLVYGLLYYLFYISLIEEVVFRGFVQNYLFGLRGNQYLIYCLGALMFSLMHLPFQMYLHGNVSLGYLLDALPQLIFTFAFHLIMCAISKKRGDLLIPIALHFAIDYWGC